jgi:hypothetical protein
MLASSDTLMVSLSILQPSLWLTGEQVVLIIVIKVVFRDALKISIKKIHVLPVPVGRAGRCFFLAEEILGKFYDHPLPKSI